MDKELIFAAVSVVKEMAGQKPMTADEIVAAISTISGGLNSIAMGTPAPACDPKKAIKEKTITCLVCGQSFKLLTAKHLASHGMTPKEYRAAYGYPAGQSLCCKDLKKFRADKMKGMKLWERKGATPAPESHKAAKGKGKGAKVPAEANTSSDSGAVASEATA